MVGVRAMTRRGCLLAGGAALVAGCARDRFRREPVVIGGAAVLPDMSVMQALDASADHRRFAAALRETGLAGVLSGPGPFTVLAPTDAAFGEIRPKEDAALLSSDPVVLKRTLRSHILPALVSVADINAGISDNGGETKVLGLNGIPATFDRFEGAIRVYDLRRRRALLGPVDAIAVNGLIHVIDDVLLLPQQEEAAEKVSP